MDKIYVERIIVKNRAPFESLDLTFKENEISVLTAVNGRGKTTILSYIVDAWHEMARPHFSNTFEGKENKFYRVSSTLFNIKANASSFVYIRFKVSQENIDYVDIRNICTEQEYDINIPIEDKIPFNEIKGVLEKMKFVKQISNTFNEEKSINIFNNNIITSFPAYRYELPGYLNDPYKIELNFTKRFSFSGNLPNPLEVITGLPQLAN